MQRTLREEDAMEWGGEAGGTGEDGWRVLRRRGAKDGEDACQCDDGKMSAKRGMLTRIGETFVFSTVV